MTTIKINVIFMGNFQYPKGMAAAKRIQHFVDYLKNYTSSIKVFILRQGRAKITRNELKGRHKGIFYKTIGNNIRFDLSILFTSLLYVLSGSICLIKWKRKRYKNILYCYYGPNIENIWFIILAKLLGFKIVFDIVEDDSLIEGSIPRMTRIKLFTFFFLERHLHRITNGLVVNSYYLKDKYNHQIGNRIPIKLIPITAVILENNKKKKFGNPVKIIYSGSFGRKDGVSLLIEAFENVHQFHKNTVLLLAGRGSNEDIDPVKKNIEKKDSIKYVGYLADELNAFLRDGDIMCMTRVGSRFANAGFPYKLGEYLASGNPVIASNVGDVGLYLENKNDAILIEPNNVQAIQQAIEYLIDNPIEAMKIGQNGKQKCKEYFDPHKNGRLILDLFDLI